MSASRTSLQSGRLSQENLEARVASILDRYRLFDGRDFVVAVSGGPDSVALALILKACAEHGRLQGRMHIAHLNHRLRGHDADADAEFVRRLARRLGAPFHLEEQDVRSLAARAGLGIEEAAREARYEFLGRVAEDVGASRIALGHTASDNVETILHRIVRGTGLTGLCGIPLRRPLRPGMSIEIVRPLLFCTRSEVLSYLRCRRARYRQDASNVGMDYFRNRIRRELIPLLEARYNPRVQEAILRLARIAALEHGFVAKEAERRLRRAQPRQKGGSLSVDITSLQKMPEALLMLAVRRLVEAAQTGLRPMTLEHYQRVADLVFSGKTGDEIELPGRLHVYREKKRLVIARQSDAPSRSTTPISVPIPGETALPDNRVLRAELVKGSLREFRRFLTRKSRWEEMLDAEQVHPPLVVRSPARGDRFHPLGAPGRKKVGDFLTDQGVPQDERTRLLLLCDRVGPIWVMGMRIDDRVKVRAETRTILKLTVGVCED